MSENRWLRTPPASMERFWASPPPSSALTPKNKQTENVIINEVSVRLENDYGLHGIFIIENKTHIRWSGQRSASRQILTELKDSENRAPTTSPNWTILFPFESISKLKFVDEEILRINVEYGKNYEFTFRSRTDINVVKAFLKTILEMQQYFNSAVKQKHSKNHSHTTRRRQSIAFDALLEDQNATDENASPNTLKNIYILEKESKFYSSDENMKTEIGAQHEEEIEKLRQLVRTITSSKTSGEEKLTATLDINNLYAYPLEVENAPLSRPREKYQIAQLLPIVKNMKEKADEEKVRVENETGVHIVTPNNKRGFEYVDKETGLVISPECFQTRYRAKILHIEKNQKLEISSNNLPSKTTEDIKFQTISGQFSSILTSKKATNEITSMQIQEETIIKTEIKATSFDEVLSLKNDSHIQTNYQEELRKEEEKLYSIIDKALQDFALRKRELEKHYHM